MKFKYFLILVVVSLVFNACKVGRFFIYNFADIKDYKKFPSRQLNVDSTKYLFAESKKLNTIFANDTLNIKFNNYLEKHNSKAFIIIKNDSILYEKYFNKYTKDNIVTSFSVAKSITSILIGCAIDDSLIKSVNEPITNYIPELSKSGFNDVEILHVLQMTSGIKFNESYINPFGHAATYYYGRNLRKQILKLKIENKPGVKFEYKSGNTQLLGLILERALKSKTVTQYLQEKIWTPLQMEFPATWSLDKKKNGIEKTFCCLNARARDFAKIGQLFANKGKWNGKQIISEKWVAESTKVDTTKGSAAYYQYQWWLPSSEGDFMAHGILGQYIYVHPEKKLVIVRLGKNESGIDWENIFISISEKF